MAAACADPMQILDGMSPHVWQGPTAAEDWWRDVLAEGERLGASGYRIALGEPQHVDVKGESAYVVAPATMTFVCEVTRSHKQARSTPSRSARSTQTGVLPLHQGLGKRCELEGQSPGSCCPGGHVHGGYLGRFSVPSGN